MPALLASALLVAATAGCGGAEKASGSRRPGIRAGASSENSIQLLSPHPARVGNYLRRDADDDSDDQRRPLYVGVDERHLLATYPDKPSASDARAIVALVRSYYAAAVAGDGSRVCSLLVPSLAAGLETRRGRPLGAPGESCAETMTSLLKREHRRLSADDPGTMILVGVHLRGALGLVVLGFRRTPESEIVVQREGPSWKMDALLDGYMP